MRTGDISQGYFIKSFVRESRGNWSKILCMSTTKKCFKKFFQDENFWLKCQCPLRKDLVFNIKDLKGREDEKNMVKFVKN